MSTTKIIALRTQDDQLFEVEERVAMELETVRQFFDDNSDVADNNTVPLPNVSGKQLSTVIDYCKNHVRFEDLGDPGKDESNKYNEEFVKKLSNEELKETILAANYLNITHLLEVLNQNVADRIKNRSVEYVRKFFGIDSDFTPEEEQQIRNENAWAFEGVDPDSDVE